MAREWKELKKELLKEAHVTEESLTLAKATLGLSELIYDLRTAEKMSQKELAHAIRVSQAYIAKVEGGEENLTLETIVKLLTALKTCLSLKPEKRGRCDSVFHIFKAA